MANRQTYLVMRMAGSNPRADEKAVLLESSAKLCTGTSEQAAVTRSGAWPGSVFAVWRLHEPMSRTHALGVARMITPDHAVVLTDTGVLVEVDSEYVRDVPVLTVEQEEAGS